MLKFGFTKKCYVSRNQSMVGLYYNYKTGLGNNISAPLMFFFSVSNLSAFSNSVVFTFFACVFVSLYRFNLTLIACGSHIICRHFSNRIITLYKSDLAAVKSCNSKYISLTTNVSSHNLKKQLYVKT